MSQSDNTQFITTLNDPLVEQKLMFNEQGGIHNDGQQFNNDNFVSEVQEQAQNQNDVIENQDESNNEAQINYSDKKQQNDDLKNNQGEMNESDDISSADTNSNKGSGEQQQNNNEQTQLNTILNESKNESKQQEQIQINDQDEQIESKDQDESQDEQEYKEEQEQEQKVQQSQFDQQNLENKDQDVNSNEELQQKQTQELTNNQYEESQKQEDLSNQTISIQQQINQNSQEQEQIELIIKQQTDEKQNLEEQQIISNEKEDSQELKLDCQSLSYNLYQDKIEKYEEQQNQNINIIQEIDSNNQYNYSVKDSSSVDELKNQVLEVTSQLVSIQCQQQQKDQIIQEKNIQIVELQEKLKVVDSCRIEDLKKFQESQKQLEQKFTLDNKKLQHSIQQLDQNINKNLNSNLPGKQDYQNNEKDQNENYTQGKKQLDNMSKRLQNMKNTRDIPQPRLTPSLPSILLFSNCERTQQFIMETLCKSKFNTYKKNQIKELNCNLIGTDPFEFENIDSREKQIAELQKVFKENPNQILQIWMAVKFERTDIMKKNLMEMYKYLNKLNIPKILVITDFHLSEDQVEDKKTLNERFKIFKFQEIKYVSEDTDPTQFLSESQKSLPGYLIDTIFEEVDEKQQQQIMDDFQRQFNKRR